MDIARAFSDSGLAQGVTINIKGTPDDPLFQASQIGALLGLCNVRDAIKDFDEEELRVGLTDTSRTATFLTELGLIRLLNMSRKPFARPFQKWVAKVIREIRLTGKYELEKQLAEKDVALTLASQKHEIALAVRDAALAARDAELAAIRSKVYEELPKLETTYLGKEIAEMASDAHKLGCTFNDKKREAQLNTGSAQGFRMLHKRATHNAKIVESVAKVALRRYHIASLGGEEHYSCNIEHSVDVVDVASTVVDTLASSFEYMTRDALFAKVIANLSLQRRPIGVDKGDDSILAVAPISVPRESTIVAFCSRRLSRTGKAGDRVGLSEISRAMTTFCARKRRDSVALGQLKTQLTAKLGEVTTSSYHGLRNYWRGWRLLADPPLGTETDDEGMDDDGDEDEGDADADAPVDGLEGS
jgi:prophage antirepressor-like protein